MGLPAINYFCEKCGCHFATHNDDGSCVSDDNYEEINLIASGYEWYCPNCGGYHMTCEIPRHRYVTCKKCGEIFAVGEMTHARH